MSTTAGRLFNTPVKIFHLPLSTPLKLYCDNESAIAIAHNQGTHSKSKAIHIEFHVTHDRVNRREIEVEYVSSKDNVADILTKSLLANTFFTHFDTLGIQDVQTVVDFLNPPEAEIPSQTEREDTSST